MEPKRKQVYILRKSFGWSRPVIYIHIAILIFVGFLLIDWITCGISHYGELFGCGATNAVGFFIPALILGIIPISWKRKLKSFLVFVVTILFLELLSYLIKKQMWESVRSPESIRLTGYWFSILDMWSLMGLTLVSVIVGFLIGWLVYVVVSKLIGQFLKSKLRSNLSVLRRKININFRFRYIIPPILLFLPYLMLIFGGYEDNLGIWVIFLSAFAVANFLLAFVPISLFLKAIYIVSSLGFLVYANIVIPGEFEPLFLNSISIIVGFLIGIALNYYFRYLFKRWKNRRAEQVQNY